MPNLLEDMAPCPHCGNFNVFSALRKIPIPANLEITCHRCDDKFMVTIRVKKGHAKKTKKTTPPIGRPRTGKDHSP